MCLVEGVRTAVGSQDFTHRRLATSRVNCLACMELPLVSEDAFQSCGLDLVSELELAASVQRRLLKDEETLCFLSKRQVQIRWLS